jgi:hypothetical protein
MISKCVVCSLQICCDSVQRLPSVTGLVTTSIEWRPCLVNSSGSP